mmetsp:Transcript_3187/g.293  ORF Transcript_3187/g.293 Transcript_3187/m.293 type:complete len:117 (+) Transcript_3187:290-640(+)
MNSRFLNALIFLKPYSNLINLNDFLNFCIFPVFNRVLGFFKGFFVILQKYGKILLPRTLILKYMIHIHPYYPQNHIYFIDFMYSLNNHSNMQIMIYQNLGFFILLLKMFCILTQIV